MLISCETDIFWLTDTLQKGEFIEINDIKDYSTQFVESQVHLQTFHTVCTAPCKSPRKLPAVAPQSKDQKQT